MQKLAIIVHGGAGPDSELIRNNKEEYKAALQEAVDRGYRLLEENSSAVDAVEAAVVYLEDHYLFNAGKGSALNENANVEMDASIMNGKDKASGAVAIIKNIKNPVKLARVVMEETKHIYLGSTGAEELAEKMGHETMPDDYFKTTHAFEELKKKKEEEDKKKGGGTVGAVALDKKGDIAAATSTGGTENRAPGRIADSSMIGIGSYADNKTCAVSATGDGEWLMKSVVGFRLSALMEHKEYSVNEASDYLMEKEIKKLDGDVGWIALDAKGNIDMKFNSERMHRAWKTSDGKEGVEIYKR